MTVGGWIGFIFVVLIILFASIGISLALCDNTITGVIIGILISIILGIAVFAGFNWYYNNTASGARAMKSQESNFNMGIKRKVTVYDIEGDIIKEYEGKFDVDYDNDRIIFDDEKGLRHIIYYPTGTVIIDEVE